ncbi:MAG: peptidylprolyl isomerase [Candidatus Delongbacteria bacterium]|nr:peptidylprolyl isomerase [Candidatus Delongbacteria bacterium]MDD4204931.1 peptidylprolyl isomerase [Candidatus Delongbacteria bacterium]
MIKTAFSYILTSMLLVTSSVFTQDGILTPFTDNIEVAVIGDRVITEFEVFGYPASVRERKVLPYEERYEIIEGYIYEILLQKESQIPTVLNTGEYRKNFETLLKKNAAMKLKDDLVGQRFLSNDKLESYCVQNSGKIDKFKLPENKIEIAAMVKKDKAHEIRIFLDKYVDSLSLSYGVDYNDELFTEITSVRADSPEEFSEEVRKNMLNKVLITFKDQKVFTNELIKPLRDVKPWRMKDLSNTKILKRLVDGSIINSILSAEAEKRGYFEKEDVKEETKDQMKYLAAKIYRDVIYSDGKFVPSKEEMIDYYIENKDNRTLWSKKKMWVFEIFREYNNEDDIEENDKINVAIEVENIRQKIISGEEFEKYAKFYPRPHSKDGELGFIFEDDYAMIGKTASKMKEGDISDLIIQQKAISVIKVTQIQEPMLYKFEYVEGIIKSNLISSKKEEYRNRHMNELFQKYIVKIKNNL